MTSKVTAVIKTVLAGGIITGAILPALLLSPAVALENNIQIKGQLVPEPCTLSAGSTFAVDFGTVIEKGLYKDKRTNSRPFTITLEGCDTRLGNSVILTFTGVENSALPGYLAVSGRGQGVGIGIGLPGSGGQETLLPVNQPSPGFALSDGNNHFTVMTWVEAEPEAIANRNITVGDFNATATFKVTYP